MPFRPKRSDPATSPVLATLRLNSSPNSGPDAVARLEAKVNGI